MKMNLFDLTWKTLKKGGNYGYKNSGFISFAITRC